jgi:hypothetical protein
MLTSEAGLGKSKLIEALMRVFGPPPMIAVAPHLPPQCFFGMLLLRIEGNTKRGDLLNGLALAMGFTPDYRSGSKAEVNRIRRQLYRAGVMLIFVDEMQFMTQSANAHAAAARALHFLRQLGVPLAFVGNYSLGHKLLQRPSEDIQRFLANPAILLPDAHDDASFIEMLRESVRVMGGTLRIDPLADAQMIHWYTGANRRAWRSLLVLAYGDVRRKAAREADVTISMDDIGRAYCSTSYSAFRGDVATCRKQLIQGTKLRDDLWCPFELEPSLVAQRAKLAHQMERAHIEFSALKDSMTPAERAGLKSIKPKLVPLAPGLDDQPAPRLLLHLTDERRNPSVF